MTKDIEDKKKEFFKKLNNYFYEKSKGGQSMWSTMSQEVQHDEIWAEVEALITEVEKENQHKNLKKMHKWRMSKLDTQIKNLANKLEGVISDLDEVWNLGSIDANPAFGVKNKIEAVEKFNTIRNKYKSNLVNDKV